MVLLRRRIAARGGIPGVGDMPSELATLPSKLMLESDESQVVVPSKGLHARTSSVRDIKYGRATYHARRAQAEEFPKRNAADRGRHHPPRTGVQTGTVHPRMKHMCLRAAAHSWRALGRVQSHLRRSHQTVPLGANIY